MRQPLAVVCRIIPAEVYYVQVVYDNEDGGERKIEQ